MSDLAADEAGYEVASQRASRVAQVDLGGICRADCENDDVARLSELSARAQALFAPRAHLIARKRSARATRQSRAARQRRPHSLKVCVRGRIKQAGVKRDGHERPIERLWADLLAQKLRERVMSVPSLALTHPVAALLCRARRCTRKLSSKISSARQWWKERRGHRVERKKQASAVRL